MKEAMDRTTTTLQKTDASEGHAQHYERELANTKKKPRPSILDSDEEDNRQRGMVTPAQAAGEEQQSSASRRSTRIERKRERRAK